MAESAARDLGLPRALFPDVGVVDKTEFFQRELSAHNCTPGFPGFQNIAVGGTTAGEWASPLFLPKVKKAAPNADHIWLTIGGNDAIQNCPFCAENRPVTQPAQYSMLTCDLSSWPDLPLPHLRHDACRAAG